MESENMGNSIITYKTLRENVAEIIRNKILNHKLEPGMRILEQDLAQELGVSRGPVREALRQLEQEGLVEYTSNRGCSVRNISILDVIEAYVIRGSFELTALKAIKGLFTKQQLEEMDMYLEQMKSMTFIESIAMDNKFHKVLISSANSPYLLKAWDNLDFVSFFNCYNEIDPASMLASTRQYTVHKNLLDIYRKNNYTETAQSISHHYMVTIERKLSEHNLSKKDLNYSLDILIP